MNEQDVQVGREGRIDSPCINVCAIEPATGLCVGCNRTLNEIAGWSSFSAGDRRRIMSELPARGRIRAATA
jgi:predicted Fe-S protein YdhL (DUF1289 family)